MNKQTLLLYIYNMREIIITLLTQPYGNEKLRKNEVHSNKKERGSRGNRTITFANNNTAHWTVDCR